MNGNKIINVGSPMKDSDVATKKYVDNRAKITLRGEGYGDAYHYDDGSKTVSMPLGKWDFCFLIGFVRSGRGDNLHKIKFSSCKLTEYLRIWTLITKSDNKGHTRCGARCVRFGEVAPLTAPTAPTSFSAAWGCIGICAVMLNWVDVDGETGYEIRRDGGFLSSPGQNAEGVFDDNIDSGTTYYYQIKACDNVSCSD